MIFRFFPIRGMKKIINAAVATALAGATNGGGGGGGDKPPCTHPACKSKETHPTSRCFVKFPHLRKKQFSAKKAKKKD